MEVFETATSARHRALDHCARMAETFETPQGAVQPLAWDDLPMSYRAVIWFCAACAAGIVALLIGMLGASVITKVIASLADPLAGMPQ